MKIDYRMRFFVCIEYTAAKSSAKRDKPESGEKRMIKKWFTILLALLMCMLMGTAFAATYEIKDGSLYVYGDLTQLPDGDYDLIQIDKNAASLSLPDEQQVLKNVVNKGTIYSGTFRGNVTNYEKICGGTFYGTVTCDNRADIYDGTFHGQVNNRGKSEIHGGTFDAASEVINNTKSNINGGTFYGKVFNGNYSAFGGQIATITNGTFTETSQVTVGRKGIISGGTFEGKLYYFIYVDKNPENGGTVTVSVDGTNMDRAMKETTVRFEVAAEAGYELDALSVVDDDGNDIALNKLGDSAYTFTMPASAVYITADFNECVKVPVLPQTGDSSAPILWLTMSILSVAGIALLRKKAYNR